MIHVDQVTKKYGDRIAVDCVQFSVARGEVVGFLGPNGAGKTTTMKIITGCMAPTHGSVSIDGLDVFEHPIRVKQKIGYLPEIPPLYEDMYVESYLRYVSEIKRCPPKQIQSLVESAMRKAGLTSVRSRLIHNLSKGYRQRVGLAGALVADPDVLILDEPTVGLDPAQVVEIRDLISDLKKSHTVILSTHILSEVEANCEKLVIINKGKIVKEGRLSDLKTEMKSRTLSIRVRKPNSDLERRLASIDGVEKVKTSGAGSYVLSVTGEVNDHVAETAVSAGLLEMKEDSFKLEDLFIQMTSSGSSTGDRV